jgi:hypothetical protein
MHRLLSLCALCATSLWLSGCVEPYVPAVVDAPTSALVVDGFINGNGRTRIKLSRTTSLATTTAPPVEKGAKLFVVDDTGQRYALTEQASGSYQSDSLQLNPARQYQLRITTVANAVYESDRVPLKVTLPIDKLAWQLDGTQLQLQVNARDPSGTSRYYRWSFIETWEFNSAFRSYLEYDPKKEIIVGRTTPIYTCWRTERPSTIKQTSTAQLSQDALIDYSILTLSTRAERVQVRYSVLVSQWVETPEEFAYNELLRKNTEAIGTVNDPLPTQLTGNVHRVDNASEPVLGFVSAHTARQQRVFIDRQTLGLPFDWKFDSPYNSCTLGEEDLVDEKISAPATLLFRNPGTIPVNYSPLGYFGTSSECADCRLRGTNVKPSFW